MNQRIKNKKAKRAASAPKPTVKSALREVETGANHLASAVKNEAKAALDRAEHKVEALLEKIPVVGETAAQKLHDLSGEEARHGGSNR